MAVAILEREIRSAPNLPTLADLGRPTEYPFRQRTTPEGYPPLYVKVLKEFPVVTKPRIMVIRQYLEGYHSHLGKEHHGWSDGPETLAHRRLDYYQTGNGVFVVTSNGRVRDRRELGHGFTNEELEEIFPKEKAPHFLYFIKQEPYGPKLVTIRIG